jgi:regulatory protein
MDQPDLTEYARVLAKVADYLDRCEHSRYLLTQKLIKKGFSKEAIGKALDFFEESGSLSDSRYARAWIRTRGLRKSEGRRRLAQELAVRGIDRETAEDALDGFFGETSEEDRCKKAAAAYRRVGNKTPEQVRGYLLRQGFTHALIRETLQEEC